MASSGQIPPRAKMLWAHVLRRAVFDYVLYKGVRKHSLDWKRAYQYVFVTNLQYDNGLSFDEVCSVFGWDPGYIRRLTLQLKKSDIKRMETEALKESFTQDLIGPCVKGMVRWSRVRGSPPIHARMVDEFTPLPDTRIILSETLIPSPTPSVRWCL